MRRGACCATRSARLCRRHPIAGKEVSGVEHADADLYTGKQVILTPIERTLTRAAAEGHRRLDRPGLPRDARCRPKAHDAAFAAVSHLPHLIAFALMNAISGQPQGKEFLSPGRARAFATSPASPPATRRCGATSCWPTAKNCWPSPRSSSATCRRWKLMIASGNGEALEGLIEQASATRAHWRMGTKHRPLTPPMLMFATAFLDIPPLASAGGTCRAARLQKHLQPRAAAGRTVQGTHHGARPAGLGRHPRDAGRAAATGLRRRRKAAPRW